MTISIGSDYTVVDNLQTITYYSKSSDTGTPYGVGVTIPNVLKLATKKVLRDGKRNLFVSVVKFHIWANQTNLVPKANDKLVDADNITWIVKEIDVESLESRYKLECVVSQ